MAPIINFKLDSSPGSFNDSVEYILQITIPSEGNSTKTGYKLSTDHVGAMWFTVAVVLVYGVGTIGLLGITSRKNRAMELMDKEVNAYLKGKFSPGGWAESGRKANVAKKPVYELIKSHDQNSPREVWALKTTDDANVYRHTSFYRKPKYKLVRAKTWAGTFTNIPREAVHSGASGDSHLAQLPAISENELLEGCTSGSKDADVSETPKQRDLN